MEIRHLQLNTALLKAPEEVVEFIESSHVDIACLQEVVYDIGGESPLKKAVEKMGYYYGEGVHFYYKPKNQTLAVAIVSRWPIIDFGVIYYNGANYQPKTLEEDRLLEFDTNHQEFPGSRGLINSVKSRGVLWVIIQTEEGVIKVMTTHFTVSDLCTETQQMFDMASMIKSLVQHSKDLPTIFSADMNIRAKSYSVAKIEEVLRCHTRELTDTLSSAHQSKIRDFPQGLATDHTFSKGLKHLETKAVEVDFSEHKAVLSEFQL